MNLLKRFASKNPIFFKTLQYVTLIMIAISGALVVGISTHTINFPHAETLNSILKYLIPAFSGAFLTAQTSTTDATLMDDKSKQNVIEDAKK